MMTLSIPRGYHEVDLERQHQELLAESAEFEAQYGVPLYEEDEAQKSYLDHFAKVSSEESECLRALEDILGAESEAERQQIIAVYGNGAYPGLLAMAEGAVRAIVAGNYTEAEAAKFGQEMRTKMPDLYAELRRIYAA